jgi:hypothetical protein
LLAAGFGLLSVLVVELLESVLFDELDESDDALVEAAVLVADAEEERLSVR